MACSRLDDDEKLAQKIFVSGQNRDMLTINEMGLYSLILTSSKPEAKQFKRWVTHEVIPSIRKTGSYSTNNPKSSAEILLMTAQQLVEQEKKINELEDKLQAAHHRIDNIDKIDIIGDKQQRLNKMVQLYANRNGLTFQQAWRDFKGAYNTAYHTNITMLVENYKMKYGIKKLSLPQYFLATDRLDDAIRVADKLINKAS